MRPSSDFVNVTSTPADGRQQRRCAPTEFGPAGATVASWRVGDGIEEGASGRATGPRSVTLLYGFAVVATVVAGTIEVLNTRSSVGVPALDSLLADGLASRIQREAALQAVVPVIACALAAAANHVLVPTAGTARSRPRPLAIVAPVVFLVGFATSMVAQHVLPDGGWFNYAPNTGVVFSNDGSLAVMWIGELLMCAGLGLTATLLLVPRVRLLWNGPRRSFGRQEDVLLIAQAVVLVVCAVAAVRLGAHLITQPGAWGAS